MSQLDGVLCLDHTEKELVHESFVVDTRDHEDHTFNGVMCNVACDTTLPAEYIELQSVSVRGLTRQSAGIVKEILKDY